MYVICSVNRYSSKIILHTLVHYNLSSDISYAKNPNGKIQKTKNNVNHPIGFSIYSVLVISLITGDKYYVQNYVQTTAITEQDY